jgi:hypothetical protein
MRREAKPTFAADDPQQVEEILMNFFSCFGFRKVRKDLEDEKGGKADLRC